MFGQEFPGPDAPLGQQVMSVGTAMVGLAAFAMVLALVEQVVLETLELNVKRGSKVFESKHVSNTTDLACQDTPVAFDKQYAEKVVVHVCNR